MGMGIPALPIPHIVCRKGKQMGHTEKISDYELERATTVGADDGGVDIDVEQPVQETETKVVASDSDGVVTK